ncbi:MAG TPA: type II toxin-antitoxin system prevent-host-death family antitoxin, partial [Candidatus Sumerlaeota bacterium]|nr:type II toxin-antitoxin system prevent-host-death family antitoxin [Candidatus Sumerlaeota bacterium]
VLLPEEDWRAIQETLHLLSIPGMRESIRKGMTTPVSKCSDDPKW